jgi:hypothetical protein
MSRLGGPPPPERHAVIDQPSAELDLHLLEAAQAGVDIPAGLLERARQSYRVSSRLGGGAGRVRADDERRVAEKAHAAEDRSCLPVESKNENLRDFHREFVSARSIKRFLHKIGFLFSR